MVRTNSGIALMTVIIFVVLISIIAIASINLMAGQALLIEHQINRIKAYYVAEAAWQMNLMRKFTGQSPANLTLGPFTAIVTEPLGSGPLNTSILRIRVDY